MDGWANPAGRPYRRVAENRGGKLLPNRNAENELPRDAPLLDSVTIPGVDEELPFVDRLPLGLSEPEKKVLQCFYEYRLSHKDIAQLYGISLEASRMKLFRARMHCRELLLKCEKYV